MSECSFRWSVLNQKNAAVKNFVCRKVTIHLRDRRADIPALIHHYIWNFHPGVRLYRHIDE
jgi:hypothetical protein